MFATSLESTVGHPNGITRTTHPTAFDQNRENRPLFAAQARFLALYIEPNVNNYNRLDDKNATPTPPPAFGNR